MSEDLLVEDYYDSIPCMTLEEEIKDGKRNICFKGILSEADKLNGNHRIYPKAVLKEAYDALQKKVMEDNSPLIGEQEHPKDAHINLERICCTFPELTWNEEKGTIEGKAVPVDNEAGRNMVALAKAGVKICFSTRCAGKVKPYNGPLSEGTDAVEVCPGLRIISIDWIFNPSCQKARTDTVYEEKKDIVSSNSKTFKQILSEEF